MQKLMKYTLQLSAQNVLKGTYSVLLAVEKKCYGKYMPQRAYNVSRRINVVLLIKCGVCYVNVAPTLA